MSGDFLFKCRIRVFQNFFSYERLELIYSKHYFTYIYIYIYIYITSRCKHGSPGHSFATRLDLPSLPGVLQATSRISTKLLYIGSSSSFGLYSSM